MVSQRCACDPVRLRSGPVLSPQTQLEIKQKNILVVKMNLDLRPQCVLVNHKAAVPSLFHVITFSELRTGLV